MISVLSPPPPSIFDDHHNLNKAKNSFILADTSKKNEGIAFSYQFDGSYFILNKGKSDSQLKYNLETVLLAINSKM